MFNDRSGAQDVLSDVLRDLHLSEAHYFQCELAESWGVRITARRQPTLHYVLMGSCWVQTGSRNRIRLRAGDAVFLPQGIDHRLLATRHAEIRLIEKLPSRHSEDGIHSVYTDGENLRARIACCRATFEGLAVHPLLELMPRVVLARSRVNRDPMFVRLLEAMAEEATAHRLGAATLITRLADVLVTRVMCAWVEARGKIPTSWLAAIRDPQIGAALAAFYREPGKAWSVVSLARAANLSRSRFSKRFTAVLGVSPARNATHWRMHVASVWLRTDRGTIAQIAMRLGYESEASFSRTFKRCLGTSPSEFRYPTRQRSPGAARRAK
jgi:AraC-like DNA-binding protein/mannose-6-phosphate isomerase-like protein (cupin superfamily)